MSSNVDFATTLDRSTWVNPNHPCASHVRVLDADEGLIERTRDKLAIVGYATSTRDLAPFDDPTYDICGLNQLYRMIPRADIWADLHENWNDDEANVPGVDHHGWVRDCGIPVLMTQRLDDLPTSVRFPIERVIAEGCDYLTSTVALLIGWGIVQGYKEIALFGIDLVVGTEYAHQRSCAEFWLGIAHGKGITVRLPPQSALLKHTHRYGYEREPESKLLSIGETEGRIDVLTKQREALLTKMRAFDGAIHEVDRLATELAGGEPLTSVAVAERLKWLKDTRFETMMELATMDGAVQEATFTKEIMTLRSRGADIHMPRLFKS